MGRNRRVLGIGALLLLAGGIAILIAVRGDDDTSSARETSTRESAGREPGNAFVSPPVAPTLVDAGAVAVADAAIRIESASDPDPVGTGTATLIGRVVRDGEPLISYGIVVTRRYEATMFAQPHPVRGTDGRFKLERIRAGTWNVLIGAPNIARETRTGVKMVADQITDLGDIEVNGGLRITGRVLDGSSRPIAGATVAVAGSGMSGFTVTDAATGEVLSKPTPESESLQGRHSAITDARGRYQLDGVIPDVGNRRLWITASHPKHGTSPRTDLPDDHGTIDFVLGATGALDGRVTVPLTGSLNVHARRINGVDSRESTRTDEEGQFHFESLHPGDYEISVSSGRGNPIWQPLEVKVASNLRASVTFAAPRDAVTVEVAVTTCSLMLLRPRDSDSFMEVLAHSVCRNNLVVFEQVQPGQYSLCRTRDCIPIEVAKGPARQRIDGTQL